MVQTGSRTDKAEAFSVANPFLPEIGAAAMKRVDALAQFQSELFGKIQEINQYWVDRIRSEAALTSEFASKLAAARSIPETTTVCQELASRRMKLASEDVNYLLGEGQKFMQSGVRLLSNGWSSSSRDGSS